MQQQKKEKQPDFDKRLRDLEQRVETLESIEEERRKRYAKILDQLDRARPRTAKKR